MFYYIASVHKNKIEILRDSCEAEFQKIKNLREPVATIIDNNRRIDPLQKTFKKISTINASLLTQTDEYDMDDLNEAISTYLFRLRKYLDNYETYLKRQFGEASVHYATFKQATKDSYDNHPKYRILYQLRNADQHCDSIVTNVSIGIADDGARYIEARARSEYLLSVFDHWKSNEKEYLKEQQEVDIFKCISITNACIHEIHQKTLNCFFSLELYENCYKIIGYSNEFSEKREDISFICQNEELTREFWEQPKKNLNMDSWMVRQCIGILALFLRNNYSVATILYHGSFPECRIDEYGIDLKQEGNKTGLEIGNLVKIDGCDYRCHSKIIDLIRDAYTIIAVNMALPREKEKQISEQFSRYIDVLIWKRMLTDV